MLSCLDHQRANQENYSGKEKWRPVTYPRGFSYFSSGSTVSLKTTMACLSFGLEKSDFGFSVTLD